jgi:SAM-dependent methyltransferase
VRGGALNRRFWSLHAASFERVRSDADAQAATDRIGDVMAEHLRPGAEVIDLGRGPGFHSLALARRGFDVVAVDYAEGMLTRATQRTTGSTVRLHEADLNRPLPFPDGAFDGAICVSVVQILESPSRTFQEVRRVLRPGGPFLVQAIGPGRRRPSLPRHLRLGDLPFWAVKRFAMLIPGLLPRYDCGSLARLLVGAGFTVDKGEAHTHLATVVARRPEI